MKKNINKIILFIILILISVATKHFLFSNSNKELELENKYPKPIGTINTKTSLLNSDHKLCGEESPKIIMLYSGAGMMGYKTNKKKFRNQILSNYKNKYTDYGYLNYRFIVNCEGKAGWFEVIEMDLNLEKTNLNHDMVNQLLNLTSKQEWRYFRSGEEMQPINYYMYVSYRIENGEITEIIP